MEDKTINDLKNTKSSFPEISVIIPFYNAEKYLERCIKSIINQTFSDYELILINNLSKDNSWDIALRYSAKDDRISLINCTAQGVSHARNLGLNTARGRYIYFADADDYLEPDTLNRLFSAMLTDSRCSCAEMGLYKEKDDGNIFFESDINFQERTFTKNAFLNDLFSSTVGHYQGYLWNKLLKRDIIVDNQISFDTDISYNEDRLFLFKYFLCTPNDGSIIYTPYRGYHYVINEESAMSGLKSRPISTVITEIYAFERMINLSDDKIVKQKIITETVRSCIIILKSHHDSSSAREYAYLIDFLKKNKTTSKRYTVLRFIFIHKPLRKIYILLKG